MRGPHRHRLGALLILAGALLFMALSAGLAYPGWERAFRSDASPVSWLSSALLLSLCVMCARLMADGGVPRGLGLWLTGAMFLLALDEQFMFHELWKYRCEDLTGLPALCEAPGVREAPILFVALFGAITVGLMIRTLPGRFTRGLLLAGIACGLWAIWIDQVPMPYPIAELEEGFEVLAEALVLAALMAVPPARSS